MVDRPLFFNGAGPPRDAETGEVPDLFRRRHEFVREYCSERGWDRAALTVNQIMEIRAQPGWKDAALEAVG